MDESSQIMQAQQDALAAIRADVSATQRLIGEEALTESLLSVYEGNEPFLKQLENNLLPAYSHFRTVRGDGICFYRSLCLSFALALRRGGVALGGEPRTHLQKGYDFTLEKVASLCSRLQVYGFSELLSDFTDALLDYLKGLSDPVISEEVACIEPLDRSGGLGDSILYGLRLCTALELLEDPEQMGYSMFVEGAFGLDVRSWVDTCVLPSFEEADNIQILAVARFLGIKISIASIDAHNYHINSLPDASEELRRVGDDEAAAKALRALPIHLLLRPGHYDLLTPR